MVRFSLLLILVSSNIVHYHSKNAATRNYKIVFERGLITNFNQSLGHLNYLKFIKVNRNSWALNVSFNLFKEMNVDLMWGTGQVYKFYANDYKLYPVSLTLPVCLSTKRDIVVKFSEAAKYTNVPFCGMMKPGHYYVNNYVFTLTPPKEYGAIMEGRYKIHGVLFEKRTNTMLFEGDAYGAIVPIIT